MRSRWCQVHQTPATINVIATKEKWKYDYDVLIKHINILPKRSAERAFAINAVAKSGDANIGRTINYKTLKKAEANNAWVADISTIEKSKPPTDMETLGLGYEGYHIEDNLKSKKMK